MRAKFLVVMILGVSMVSTPASACGLLASDSGSGEVNGFTALLSHDGSTEDLIVTIEYGGGDTDGFGWLMAFPAPPDIEKADEETLRAAIAETAPPDRRDHVPSVLPVLCACSAGSGDTAGVTELDRTRVDDLEFVTIRGSGLEPVKNWFRKNDFTFHDRQEAALASYVERGWVIVVAQVAKDAPQEARLSPIRFSFTTEDPVYPLALAGSEHPGALPMTLLTLTPFRPAVQGLPQEVARPDDASVFPPLEHIAQLRFSDRLDEEARRRLEPELEVADGTWLSRFEAEWDTAELRTDLVLEPAAAQDPVNYDAMLARFESQRPWASAGRTLFLWIFISVFVLMLAGFPVLVGGIFGGFRRRSHG